MLKRVLCLLPLLVVACAVESTPDDASHVGQTGEALTPATGVVGAPSSIAMATYAATDGAITISYLHAGGLGGTNTLALTGGPGSASVPESSLGSSRFGATFTGLQSCTAYAYTIANTLTGTQASGTLHTRAPGNVACTAGDTIAPAETYTFRGVFHSAKGCDETQSPFAAYPSGTDWTGNYDTSGQNFAPVGYQHSWQQGSCEEDFVDARRAWFRFPLNPDQIRRTASAAVVGNYTQSFGPASCLNGISLQAVQKAAYPVAAASLGNANVWGMPWAIGGSVTNWGIEIAPNRPVVAGVDEASLVFSQGRVTGNFGKPSQTTIEAGFALVNDGYASPYDVTKQYAWDNTSCMFNVTGVGLALTYADLQADTPHDCSWSLNCNTPTVSCSGVGDLFAFHVVGNDGSDTTVSTYDNTATPTNAVTVRLPDQTDIKGVYACTISASGGSQSCTPLMTTPSSAVSCTPVCTSALSCPGDAKVYPTLDVRCSSPADFYRRYTDGTQTFLGTFAEYKGGTSPSATTSFIVGCTPGTGQCNPPASEYVAVNGFCGVSTPIIPPNLPPCDVDACNDDCMACNGSKGQCGSNHVCLCKSKKSCS